MNLKHTAVALLRILLVLLFAASLVGQTLSWPGQCANMAQEELNLAHLRWPLTAVAVLSLLCVEVVIVCTWKLLTMVLLLGGSVTLAVTIYLGPELRDPGLPMALGGMVLVGGVVVLLMAVMRALLRQAADLRTDMDAVI
jgi:hypothetical protein